MHLKNSGFSASNMSFFQIQRQTEKNLVTFVLFEFDAFLTLPCSNLRGITVYSKLDRKITHIYKHVKQ